MPAMRRNDGSGPGMMTWLGCDTYWPGASCGGEGYAGVDWSSWSCVAVWLSAGKFKNREKDSAARKNRGLRESLMTGRPLTQAGRITDSAQCTVKFCSRSRQPWREQDTSVVRNSYHFPG